MLLRSERYLILCMLAALMMGPFSIAWASTEAQQVPLVRIRRAISIHNVLNWPEMKMVEGIPQYYWPPFSTDHYVLRTDDLRRAQKAGFDTIRLTVGPGIFLSANENQRLQLDTILADRVKMILDVGLNVIVDFHPRAQDPRYPPIAFTRASGEPVVESFRVLLIRTALLLSKFPQNRVVLEILNEPELRDWGQVELKQWQLTQKSYYESIRRVAPMLTLMVTGSGACCGFELTRFDPTDLPDRNTYFTFHFYSPHAFTHQGVVDPKNKLSSTRFIANLPFPLGKTDIALLQNNASEAFDNASIDVDGETKIKAKKDLQTTLDRLAQFMTTSDVDEGIQKTYVWAKRHGIPSNQIFLGEFGVMRTVDPQSRMNWLRAVVVAVERRGMSWGYWNLDTPEGMGLIIDHKDRSFDPLTIEALGLMK